ncbi:MAG: hypothetical protein OXI74_08515, partial [Rhodospirillaceae bacterium]|nr:hypothetical protein [Rhodospirillaceae bacterium]
FSDELQALCFAAGANSIFYGDTLLTTENPEEAADRTLFRKLGLKPEQPALKPGQPSLKVERPGVDPEQPAAPN